MRKISVSCKSVLKSVGTCWILVGALCVAWTAAAQTSAPPVAVTNYVISPIAPEQHLVEVQVFLPEGAAQRELQLPVWNALYQVRDFVQYVNWVRAKDRAGRPLALHELHKSLWQVSGAEHGAIVEYQIFVDSFGTFGAENYDRLVDSPVEIGKFQESDFDEAGAHFRVIIDAESADYDMAQIVGELHKIVAAATSWM